ncbi:MAG: hypothetical protein LBL96_00770 [Clostridiales bacterium]|nr:hypothetical protein [Clostridiales bacterium]
MHYIVSSRTTQAFYHQKGRGIVRRVFDQFWREEQIVFPDAHDNYTIHVDQGVIYIFCQDDSGDITLVTISKDGEVSKRVMLKNSAGMLQDIIIYPIIQPDRITIIYNQPVEERGSRLLKRHLSSDGWSEPEQIDHNRGGLFDVQRLGREHLLLFYQTRVAEWNLCCREIMPDKIGALKTIFSSNYYISDTSFLTTQDAIHALFIVKSMFGSQLIYRRNATGEFSAPIALNDAQRLENCLLYIARGVLYAAFMQAGNLFFCLSRDMGATFDKPKRYESKFCRQPEKAQYVGEHQMSEQTMYCRQIYVDKNHPWDAQIIPDVYENFYVPAQQDDAWDDKMETLESEIAELREQVALRDKQIANFNKTLKQRGYTTASGLQFGYVAGGEYASEYGEMNYPPRQEGGNDYDTDYKDYE